MRWLSHAAARLMRLVGRASRSLHPRASVHIRRDIPRGTPRVIARDSSRVAAEVNGAVARLSAIRAAAPAGMLIAMIIAFAPVDAARAAGAGTCTGQFPNPITDICWSCILPISIGSVRLGNLGDQEDIDNPSRQPGT